MSTLDAFASKLTGAARPVFGSRTARCIAYLGLCGAYLLILTGRLRWLGALGLQGCTLLATGLAPRFGEWPAGPERFMAASAFFEHLGWVGGFLLMAWLDLQEKRA